MTPLQPAINAGLNAASAVLLLLGWWSIRRRRIARHRACMLAALASSTAFLASYLVYHARVGSVPYQGAGWSRAIYFAILVTHTILAALIAPMALATLRRALQGRFDRHARLGRLTLPLWIYVSVTGVVIYVMLYGLGRPE